jgi:hypothetical protein
MNIAIKTHPSPVISQHILRERLDLALLDAAVSRLDAVVERLASIEAKLSVTDSRAGEDQITGARSKTAESMDRLSLAGVDVALGPNDLVTLLHRSRRDVDRMRSQGKLPREDFRLGRSPRWRPETIKSWFDRQGGRK